MFNDDVKHISNLVRYQFPAFYKEHGPSFITFLEAYYQWLEQDSEIIGQSRNLLNLHDIDYTTDQYLSHFREKYMDGLPQEILGNQRLFQKHILDLYGAKGSDNGIKLLFRLLYNEDIEIYVPSYDIFNSSDNTWIQPQYIEVTVVDDLESFVNKVITGSNSLSTAVVEKYEKKKVNNKIVHLLFLSNISGVFELNEIVMSDGITISNSPRIIGSPQYINVIGSSANLAIGDIIVDSNTSIQKPLKAVVSSVFSSIGTITFSINNGGTYYSLDADISISAGANTSGSGADFEIYEITDTFPFSYSTDIIGDYSNVAINAAAYGFPADANANMNTIISDALTTNDINVGTISQLISLNPGVDYDDNITVSVVDPHTSTRFIPNGNGGFSGLDAVITGEALYGSGLVSSVKVYDSGYGYNRQNLNISFRKVGDPTKSVSGNINLGPVGVGVGYFDNTKGFTSQDKFLFDGHYYQDFSYVVKATKNLRFYKEILKKTVHPAGNALYGITKLSSVKETSVIELSNSIVQE